MKDIKTIIADLENEISRAIKEESKWVKQADAIHKSHRSYASYETLTYYNLPRTQEMKNSLELHTTQMDLLKSNRNVELENSLIETYEELIPLLNKYNESVEKYLKENFQITLDK